MVITTSGRGPERRMWLTRVQAEVLGDAGHRASQGALVEQCRRGREDTRLGAGLARLDINRLVVSGCATELRRARQVLAVLGDSRSVSRARLHPSALARSPAAEDTDAHPVAVVGQEASCPLAEKQRPATDNALADRLDAADACHVKFLPIPRLRRQSELHTPEALLPLLPLPGLRNHLLRLVGGNLLVPEKGHRVVAPATGQGRERL